jgi:hypothetical protein
MNLQLSVLDITPFGGKFNLSFHFSCSDPKLKPLIIKIRSLLKPSNVKQFHDVLDGLKTSQTATFFYKFLKLRVFNHGLETMFKGYLQRKPKIHSF